MHMLERSFYDRDTILVAKDLLGKYLFYVENNIEHVGKIVEVEAYLGQHDLACHSSKGVTKRTQIMFGPPGYAYVYLIYGMYHCFNVVTEHKGQGSAVLIRAVEPVKNVEGRTQGPGLLCKALGINRSLNGHDLLSDNLFIAEDINPIPIPITVVNKPRIGVAYAKHWADELLRFYIKDNKYISKV